MASKLHGYSLNQVLRVIDSTDANLRMRITDIGMVIRDPRSKTGALPTAPHSVIGGCALGPVTPC